MALQVLKRKHREAAKEEQRVLTQLRSKKGTEAHMMVRAASLRNGSLLFL